MVKKNNSRMVIYVDGSSSKIYLSVKISQSIVTVFSITLHTDMLMYYKYMLFSIFDITS